MQFDSLDPSEYTITYSDNDNVSSTIEIKNDGIVIFFDQDTEKIERIWLDNGNTHIAVPKDASIEDAVQCARQHIKDNTVTCCGCDMTIPRNCSRHFAGVMCDACWEKYKKENSRICSICKQPLYKCYC